MKKYALTLLVLCCLGFAGPAHAFTGNELYEAMRVFRVVEGGGEGDAGLASLALGYVMGSTHTLSFAGAICPAGGSPTAAQYMDIVYGYIEKTPETRHLPATILIAGVLMAEFPCEKPKKKGETP